MVWFKLSGKDEEYEPLYPQHQSNSQKSMLKWALISGGIGVVLTTVLVVLILDGTSSDSEDGVNLILNAPAPTTAPSKSKEGGVSYPRVLRAEEDPTIPEEEKIIIEIDQGKLEGLKMKSRGGREYLAFLGIPYAKPPLGDLRFKPPVEPEPWNGTLNAKEIPLECIQKDKYNINLVTKGREDCLYLNVYTPKKLDELGRRRNRFPVMFYIHGGGQFGNGSRYRGDYLMDENVVFITVHYRLGVFGNLNTNDSIARGNQGLKDQVMALQWIKDNIKQFGGNPRKVTIFGNSYGSMEVNAHLFSPMSKGLFHRAIHESGVLIRPGMINENPRKTAFELGQKLNCSINGGDNENSTELIECLREIPADEIILSSFNDPFMFSIEPISEDPKEDTILPDHPLKLLQNGDINKVPAIFGVNSAESLFTSLEYLNSENKTNDLNQDFNEVIIQELLLDLTASNPENIATNAHQFYFGNKTINRETEKNLTNLVSDRFFIHPNTVTATFQSENNGRRNDVFLYYFNRKVAKKYSRNYEAVYGNTEFLGASHADELQLLFPYDDFPYVSLDSEYANISITMIKLWASFAEDGKPSGGPSEWTPIKLNEKPYKFYELNDNPGMIDPVGDRMKFWDGFNLTDLYESKDPMNPRALS